MESPNGNACANFLAIVMAVGNRHYPKGNELAQIGSIYRHVWLGAGHALWECRKEIGFLPVLRMCCRSSPICVTTTYVQHSSAVLADPAF